MNIRKLTPTDYPAIVEIHNSLNIVWPTWPGNTAAWIEADRNRDPKCRVQRFVAEEGGQVVGAASYANRLDDYHPQKFYINIEVLAAFRNRGIGAALHDQLMEDLQQFDPRILRTDILVNQIQSYPFMEKRGFKEVWRETPVHLEVAKFDLKPYVGLESDLATAGITICTLAELAGDPDRDRKVYDLYMELAKDVPSELPEFVPAPYEDWLKWCLYDPATNPDAVALAVFQDQYVSLHDMGVETSGQALLGGLLGTLPAFRNKRIGLALVLRAIKFAQQNSITEFKTCTAKVNLQMQALFNKLGFDRDPEWLQCEKVIS
jgi:mycothiol synthase